MVPPLRRVTFSNSRKSNQKGRAPGWVPPSSEYLHSGLAPWGPRRTGIHALTALSPHPCGSAHCARPAFSLHPSRVLRCLGFLRIKIKSALSRSRASRLKPVPLNARALFSGTGFSREGAGENTGILQVYEFPASLGTACAASRSSAARSFGSVMPSAVAEMVSAAATDRSRVCPAAIR